MVAFSAEPGRKAPYSTDVRWRVVWQRAGMQLGIAQNLNIAVGTVSNIWKKFVNMGDVTPRKADYVDRSIDIIRDYI